MGIKEEGLNLLEEGVKKAIEVKYDAAFDKLQEHLKTVIKPDELDIVMLAVTEKVQPKLKELLLAGADKIDGQVG